MQVYKANHFFQKILFNRAIFLKFAIGSGKKEKFVILL